MKTLHEFTNFFESELRPVLERFEVRRKEIVKKFLVVVAVTLLIGGTVAISIEAFREVPVLLLFVLFGVIAVVAVTWWFLTRKFVLEFKLGVIGPIVTFCDPSLVYTPRGGVSERRFRESEIFKSRIDRFRGEDHVRGTVGATAIEFSELHAQYKTRTTDSKGRSRTQWHTIFRGLFFVADFNKHFNGTTVVLPDVAERLFGFLGKKLQAMNLFRGELIKLEDPEFEKNFVVYGDDQVEARYILSPALMSRITEFKKKTDRKVHLSFVRSNVFVAISMTRNLFEPKMFRSMVDANVAAEYLQDLQFATGIVEDLNLNTRIWTKE